MNLVSPSKKASTPFSSDRSRKLRGSERPKDTTKLGAKDLRRRASIRPSQLQYPKSQYQNYVPPIPICPEKFAVADLLEELGLPNRDLDATYPSYGQMYSGSPSSSH